jgi:diaminopimelate decarboxylase
MSTAPENPFSYENGILAADGVTLDAIANAVGTPVYCYSTAALVAGYRAFADGFAAQAPLAGRVTICYAMKANGNLAVLRTLAAQGAGVDVVSEGEMRRALAAGVPPGRIVFSGVGKTRSEMAAALEAGILQINVESDIELVALDEVARSHGVQAPVALRVNPDVEAGTLDKISTGRKHDKFGIDWDLAPQVFHHAVSLPGIDPVGIAVHIGSQLTSLAPYRDAFERVVSLARALQRDGVPIRRLDFGGGLGIRYRDEAPPSVSDYAAIIAELTAGLDCDILVEPGRRVVGPAGVLLTRVVRVKETPHRRFLIVDAAMNDLVRPAMYEAWHDMRPVRMPVAGAEMLPHDVVGPICESTDIFAAQRDLPPLREGDLLAFDAAGAYGAAMASEYNGRPLVPEVLLKGGEWALVRRRPTYQEMLALDSMPVWLSGPSDL